jgi:hypothetical protein
MACRMISEIANRILIHEPYEEISCPVLAQNDIWAAKSDLMKGLLRFKSDRTSQNQGIAQSGREC